MILSQDIINPPRTPIQNQSQIRIKIHQHRILIRPFDWSPRPAVQAHLFTLIDTPPLHLSVASLTTPTSELRRSPHQSPHSVDMGPIRNRTANQLECTSSTSFLEIRKIDRYRLYPSTSIDMSPNTHRPNRAPSLHRP